MVLVCPPVNPVVMALPAVSAMPVPLLFRSKRIVPSPEPVFTATVYEAPVPVTVPTEVPVTPPLVVRVKSLESTPLTLPSKVPVNRTVAPLVGLAPAVLIDTTVGAIVSFVNGVDVNAPQVLLASWPWTETVCPPSANAVNWADVSAFVTFSFELSKSPSTGFMAVPAPLAPVASMKNSAPVMFGLGFPPPSLMLAVTVGGEFAGFRLTATAVGALGALPASVNVV